MSPVWCPACGAAVASGAAWCTLCYADLREKAAPAVSAQPETTHQLPAQSQPAGGGRHRHAPRHAASATPRTPAPAAGIAADLLDPAFDRPVMTHADALRTLSAELPTASAATPATTPLTDATWPCLTCGASVAMTDELCPQCGSAFLAGADAPLSVKLPGVGDVTSMSRGMRVAVMAAGAIAVMVVLLLLLAVFGHFV